MKDVTCKTVAADCAALVKDLGALALSLTRRLVAAIRSAFATEQDAAEKT